MAGAELARLGYGTVTMTVVLTDWLEVELTKPAAAGAHYTVKRGTNAAGILIWTQRICQRVSGNMGGYPTGLKPFSFRSRFWARQNWRHRAGRADTARTDQDDNDEYDEDNRSPAGRALNAHGVAGFCGHLGDDLFRVAVFSSAAGRRGRGARAGGAAHGRERRPDHREDQRHALH